MEPVGSADVVDAPSINAVKAKLSRIRDNQMSFFVD